MQAADVNVLATRIGEGARYSRAHPRHLLLGARRCLGFASKLVAAVLLQTGPLASASPTSLQELTAQQVERESVVLIVI
jgi:hypothetical protein